MFGRTVSGHLRKKGAQDVIFRMLLTTAVTMTVGGMAFVNNAYGATVNQGVIKVKSGNVRQSASTSAPVAFCVKANDNVAMLGEQKGTDGNVWIKVSLGGNIGFVRSDLITKTENKITVSDNLVEENNKTQDSTSTPKISQTDNDIAANVGVVNASYVRVRDGASTNSKFIKYLDKGAIVNISSEGKGSDGKIWYQVKLGNEIGFIRSDLVNKVVISKEQADNKEENKEENNNTDVNNTNQDKITPNILEDDENIIAGGGLVKGTSVRVRDEASTRGNVLTTVNNGDNLAVLGAIVGDGRQWLKVKISAGGELKSGYIAADYVTVYKGATNKNGDTNNENIDTKEENKEEQKSEEAEDKSQPSNYITTADNAASIKGVGVRVRQTPVTGNVLCQLSSGHPLTIIGKTDGQDGHEWYQVAFSYQGNAKEGYVREDFVTVMSNINEQAPIGDAEFEASISAFPEGYKNSLRALHAKHPMWRFNAVDTGLEWNDALKAESAVGKNLVSKNSVASWKSTAAQAYNWSNNTWYTFDGGSWVSASPELIAYYMDPRNFLNESGIYQFESLEYNDTQKKDSVAKMLNGTFMSGGFTDTDGTSAEYSDVFVMMGQMTGVSPYLLAGRCLQEQGIYGKSQSIAGNVPGHEGYFNYFNVGAYAYSGRSATINGLIYAKGSDEESARPWNTRMRSIFGGAKYISDKFIQKGQDTLYFQKFNVVNRENTLYSHQYMSNIQAASSESARIQLAYLGDDEALTFKIPYFRNMPVLNCQKPISDSSPNTYLGSLSVDGCELLPAFSGATENYLVNVDSSVEYITINATPVSATSSVGGIGTFAVNPGSNVYRIACKSQNGKVKTYTITVQR